MRLVAILFLLVIIHRHINLNNITSNTLGVILFLNGSSKESEVLKCSKSESKSTNNALKINGNKSTEINKLNSNYFCISYSRFDMKILTDKRKTVTYLQKGLGPNA